ncbi:MAG: DUF1080 domain-containing protein [Flavitalea sp.]
MTRLRHRTIGVLIVFLLYNPHALFSQRRGEWQDLFNGKADYKAVNGQTIGTIVSHQPYSILVTEKIYSNFILELLLDTTMNSGIQIRSQSKPGTMNGRVRGYQVEVDPSKRKWSGMYDLQLLANKYFCIHEE